MSVPGLGTKEVRCSKPWTPPATGTSHACLLVRVSCLTMNDPGPTPTGWSPSSYRHVGQRNLTVVEASPGDRISFELSLAILSPEAVTLEFAVLASWRDDGTHPWRVGRTPGALQRVLEHMAAPVTIETAWLGVHRALAIHRQGPESEALLSDAEVREFVEVSDLRSNPERATRPRGRVQSRPVRRLASYVHLTQPTPVQGGAGLTAKVSLVVPKPRAGSRMLSIRIAQLEDGAGRGGYTIVVVLPETSDRGRLIQHQEEVMARKSEAAKAQKGRGNDPDARQAVVGELVDQLTDYLPITGLVDLSQRLPEQGLLLRGQRISLTSLETQLPKEVFPIRDRDELEEKIGVITRVAVTHVQQDMSQVKDPQLRDLAEQLGRAPDSASRSIPTGHFAGPSRLGSSPSGEES